MAFLTLFRIFTGDNWNGIMKVNYKYQAEKLFQLILKMLFKDTLKDNVLCEDDDESKMCLASFLAPVYFIVFVLMAQFVLVNVVVAVLMKHLDVNINLDTVNT